MTKRAVYSRIHRLVGAIALTVLVAGCGFDRDLFLASQSEFEAQTPYTTVPLGQAWINAPAMTLVMQRGLLNGSEQRIGLSNDVPVPGDNLVILRSRSGAAGAGRLRFEELMNRVGGAPLPFQNLKPGELTSGEDAHGSYLWAERLMGGDITCVLGIRRLTYAVRPLPNGAAAMDVMLRNCARGTAAEALRPMLEDSIAVRRTAGDGGGNTLMLSPLAAPGVE